MPQNYHCDSCGFIASVGWFHYHLFDSGYGAETLCVCRKCGTMHTVRHPIPRTLLEPYFEYAVKIVGVRKRKLDAMLLIRKHRKCSPQEAKTLVESLPLTLLSITGDGERDAWEKTLSSIGVEYEFEVLQVYQRNYRKRMTTLLAQPRPIDLFLKDHFCI